MGRSLAPFSLLAYIEQDQALVFVSNRGSNPHVSQYGCHYSRRKLLGSSVAAAAVGAKALFTLHSHDVGIIARDDEFGGCIFPARGRSGEYMCS